MMNWRALFQKYADRDRDTYALRGRWSVSYYLLGAYMDELDLPQPPGAVVTLPGDFNPGTLVRLFRLIERGCIIVPLAAQAGNAGKEVAALVKHPFYDTLRERGHPGLVLFTSGSSGKPKAAVHDLALLLKKFERRTAPQRILAFLSFDHWGGLNTMFHTLSNGGTLVVPQSRRPTDVCAAIEAHRVEVLPTSPSFLNMLLASGEYHNYDLSSLTTISYGTEPMPPMTLQRLADAFPGVKLQQTYGLIEIGVLRSKSKASDSPWVKIGGEGYQTRVVDGLLEIKADSAMLGYLNAPSPFTDDGWFKTGDAVEVDGDYYRILGRKSEQINVGGDKVYPQEVEACILELPTVADVTVYGEPHAFLGHIVCAKVVPKAGVNTDTLAHNIKKYCRVELERFKVPVRVTLVDELHTDRYKKSRA